MGDKHVMLTCQVGVKISDIVEASKEGLSLVFETIKPWYGIEAWPWGIKKCGRDAGIPPFLWTVDCFRKVLNTFRRLIDVYEATLNWEGMEFARLKVRLAVVSKVQICEEIWINEQSLSNLSGGRIFICGM